MDWEQHIATSGNEPDMDAWMKAQPPEMLRLADGHDVPHRVGQEIFNHYDMKAGVITRLADRPQPDTSGRLPGGVAWWVDTTAGYLDGSRMCTVEFARRKGWLR